MNQKERGKYYEQENLMRILRTGIIMDENTRNINEIRKERKSNVAIQVYCKYERK